MRHVLQALLLAFARLVVDEADPDVLLTFDPRGIGLVASRHAELLGKAKPKRSKAGAGGAGGAAGGDAEGGAGARAHAFSLGRDVGGETKVASVTTYSKAWTARGGRQQTAENLETHEVTGCAGRFALDVLRALVCHQAHKLTTYSFEQAVEAP